MTKANGGNPTNSNGTVYSAYITLKNGRRIYASWYGLKAFAFTPSTRKPKTK
jgi:hypothetical protein